MEKYWIVAVAAAAAAAVVALDVVHRLLPPQTVVPCGISPSPSPWIFVKNSPGSSFGWLWATPSEPTRWILCRCRSRSNFELWSNDVTTRIRRSRLEW